MKKEPFKGNPMLDGKAVKPKQNTAKVTDGEQESITGKKQKPKAPISEKITTDRGKFTLK